MCKAEARDAKVADTTVVPINSQAATSQLLNSEKMELLCNIILGSLYFVLPTGLGLAIFLQDKRTELLSAQIELLERLWHQNHQH